MKKKLIGIILCVMAIMCISAITAFAEDNYTYDAATGVLTINNNDGLSSWPRTVDSVNVTSIVIGSNVTDAADFSSLNGCSNVVNITFKNKATVNGEFSGMFNLTTVTFEENCTISSAFSGCSNLKTITFKGTSNLKNAFSNSCSIEKITFGGATTIGEGVFCGEYSPNTVLTELVFPAGSKIQSNAFLNYTGLTSVIFDGDITLEKDTNNAYYISPFYSCTGLKSVEFKGTSTLSGSAFYGCTALESVIFNGASTISGSAFYGCTALESVEFKGTSTISGAAFQGSGASLKSLSFGGATTIASTSVFACGGTNTNTELTKLVFPAGSKLPQAAFQSYTGLKTVTFEGSVTLNEYSFPGCSQLNDFYFNSPNASDISLKDQTFRQLAETINIYVPETAVEAYKNKLTSLGTPSTNYASCVKANDAHATHSWSEGVCSICNVACKHADETTGDWVTDSTQHWKVYSTCGAKSDLGNHSWSNGVCSTCRLACTHNWSEGACSICTLACSHSWSNGVCSICRLVCTHADEAKQWAYNETQHWEVYSTCGAKTDPANHEYGTDNKCTTCGYTKPVATYSGGSGSTVQKPTVTTPESGKVTLSSNGRTATITPEEGYQVASVTVNGVDKGKVTELVDLKTGDEVVVTFEKTKETLDKEASEAVGALSSMKARSSKTSKGNVKIVMNLSSTEKARLAELKAQGYTVKYKFYRSTKKSSGYTAMKTKGTTTYINTKGVKKTMYYYKARVLVYDQDGKLVASTKLSDCKYANRTWTKK